jgi:hypothetical protein
VAKSPFKRPHRTHAFGQRPGEPYPQVVADGGPGGLHSSDESWRLFTELCELVPDATARASAIGVSPALEEAWRRGERLPVLRAHRKSIERALRASSVREVGPTPGSG